TTTADANGNYSFTVFGNGGYTVTPAKTGLSFQPSSQSVVVNKSSSSVVDFTATPTLQSISISVAAGSIAKGSTVQFTAIGTFGDGSTQNLTNSVSWNSSNTSVATVSGSGLASGVGGGSTTITASQGGITSNTVSLTVSAATLQSIT